MKAFEKYGFTFRRPVFEDVLILAELDSPLADAEQLGTVARQMMEMHLGRRDPHQTPSTPGFCKSVTYETIYLFSVTPEQAKEDLMLGRGHFREVAARVIGSKLTLAQTIETLHAVLWTFFGPEDKNFTRDWQKWQQMHKRGGSR